MKKIVYLLFFLFILSSCTIDIVGEKFTVTFDSRGGSSINDVIVDQEVVVFDNPTKEGNTFLGWYKDINDETSKIVDSKSLNNNITLFAKWEVNEYTITFDSDGGSDLDSITKEFGSALGNLAVPIKDDYIFNGWFIDENRTNEFKSETMIASNITLYAKWDVLTFTVNFYNIHNQIIDTQTVEKGVNLEYPTLEPIDGYTFVSWSEIVTNITSDLDVYPIYEIDSNLFPYTKISEVKTLIDESPAGVDVTFAGTVIGFDSSNYAHVADATGAIYVRAANPNLYLGAKVKISGTGFVYQGSDSFPEYTRQIKYDNIVVENYDGDLSIPISAKKIDLSVLSDTSDYKNNLYLGNLVTVTGYVQVGADKYSFYLLDEQSNEILSIHHYSRNFNNQITDSSTNKFLSLDGEKVTITGVIYRYYTSEDIYTIQCIGLDDDLIVIDTHIDSSYLNIFSINDTHGAFNTDDRNIGLDKVASVISDLESQNGDYIKIANGDIFQGSYVSNINKGLPLIDALNKLNFDAFVIGNHEFDWGIEEIAKYKDGNLENGEANFPFLAANIVRKNNGQKLSWTEDYTIIERNGQKTAIIGAIGYGLESSILTEMVEDYQFLDPVPIVEALASQLRSEENVDFVIVALHDYTESINRRISNLTGNSYVDAVLCAHTHQQISEFEMREDEYNMPIAQGRAKNGTVIDLRIELRNSNVYKAVINQIAPDSYPSSQEFLAVINKYQDDINEGDRVLTYTTEYLSRYRLGNEMIKAMLDEFNVDVAIINTGGVRTELSTGNIRVKDVFEVFPFDNAIVLTTLSGSTLRSLLDDQGSYLYFNNDIIYNINDYDTYNIVTIDYVYTNNYYSSYFNATHTLPNRLMRDVFIDYLESN
ncbi:MAG: InlB B-repeat-containing protein [Bacilli bacterium]|jgi:uncharacterized repeat protein (TIGR02543 family)